MIDQDRRELERQADLGDAQALQKLQVLNDRLGHSQDAIDYLQEYLNICEAVLGTHIDYRVKQISLGDGLTRLKILNEKYRKLLGTNFIKDRLIIRDNLFYIDTRIYGKCELAWKKAREDQPGIKDQDLDLSDCSDPNCKVCDQELVDGWIPSRVC